MGSLTGENCRTVDVRVGTETRAFTLPFMATGADLLEAVSKSWKQKPGDIRLVSNGKLCALDQPLNCNGVVSAWFRPADGKEDALLAASTSLKKRLGDPLVRKALTRLHSVLNSYRKADFGEEAKLLQSLLDIPSQTERGIFAEEMPIMMEMGLADRDACLEALILTNGSVDDAVEWLVEAGLAQTS